MSETKKFSDSLVSDITKYIENLVIDKVKSFTKQVSESNNLEYPELIEVWNSLSDIKISKDSKPDKKKVETKDKAGVVCEAMIKSTGQQCTFKISEKSESGKYCGRHISNEKEGKKSPKKK